MLDLSVIVPIYNEAESIKPLYDELVTSLKTLSLKYELIFVNDGSSDGSLSTLKQLQGITIIDLNRNYGQATAIDAGFRQAQGNLIVTLDGDGQNDPADIPALIKKLQDDNLDIVAGWRKNRQDKMGIRLLSRFGKQLRSILIQDTIHDSGCTLRVYKKQVVKSITIKGDMHRYILALARWKGFTIGELVVNDRTRNFGKSKYNYTKSIGGFIDLLYVWFIYKYSDRPLHLFGSISALSFIGFILSGCIALYEKLFVGLNFNRDGWFFVMFFLLLSSIILFSFGVVIDLLLDINISDHKPAYVIREIITT